MIEEIAANSPAAKAGVQVGDTLTMLDGKAVLNADDLRAALAEKDAGHEATLDMLRAGKAMQVKATLARR